MAEGTEVQFNINGVFYKRSISGNEGRTKLNINLPQGEYVITAYNPVTGEGSSNIVKVISQLTENHDLVKYFRNSSQYRIKVLDKQGNAVGAREIVTFNINGVMYTRYTNELGYVSLNINLIAGNYTITAMYDDNVVSNNIEVLPIIIAHDLYKKYGVRDSFNAKIIDGQGNAVVNESVLFNINGVFYNRITNNEGIAKLNINLPTGEYIITSTYNGFSIGNKVTVSNWLFLL